MELGRIAKDEIVYVTTREEEEEHFAQKLPIKSDSLQQSG